MPRTDPSSNNPSQRQSLCSARTLFWHKSIGLWNELWNLEIGARHDRTSEDHLIWKKHHEELGFVLDFHSIFRSSSSSSWCCPFRLRLFRWYLFLPFGSPRWLRGGSCRRLWGFNWLLITWTWIPPRATLTWIRTSNIIHVLIYQGLVASLSHGAHRLTKAKLERKNWKGKTFLSIPGARLKPKWSCNNRLKPNLHFCNNFWNWGHDVKCLLKLLNSTFTRSRNLKWYHCIALFPKKQLVAACSLQKPFVTQRFLQSWFYVWPFGRFNSTRDLLEPFRSKWSSAIYASVHPSIFGGGAVNKIAAVTAAPMQLKCMLLPTWVSPITRPWYQLLPGRKDMLKIRRDCIHQHVEGKAFLTNRNDQEAQEQSAELEILPTFSCEVPKIVATLCMTGIPWQAAKSSPPKVSSIWCFMWSCKQANIRIQKSAHNRTNCNQPKALTEQALRWDVHHFRAASGQRWHDTRPPSRSLFGVLLEISYSDSTFPELRFVSL